MGEWVPVIAALTGAVVGGLVSEARAYLTDRREQRRAKRRVLAILLELQYQFRRSDANALSKQIGEQLRATIPGVEASWIEAIFSPVSVRAMLAVLPSDQSVGKLGEQLEDAVDALAIYDPWLAFKIRGYDSVLRLEETAGNLFAFLPGVAGIDPSARDEDARARIIASAHLFESAGSDLDAAVRDVALSLSIFDWVRAKQREHQRGKRRGATTRQAENLMAQLRSLAERDAVLTQRDSP